MKAYRLALLATELVWWDTRKLLQVRGLRSTADQVFRAIGSIGANLAEGYSRGTGRDRARFYEYALSSAREARHWYFSAHHALSEAVTNHRLELLTHMIRLLLSMIPQQRKGEIREPAPPYLTLRDPASPIPYDEL